MSFTNDKFLHFTISFLLVPYFTLLSSNLIVGILIAFAIGLVKEIYDHISPHHTFDMMDIVFNVLGIVVSSVFLLLVGVV